MDYLLEGISKPPIGVVDEATSPFTFDNAEGQTITILKIPPMNQLKVSLIAKTSAPPIFMTIRFRTRQSCPVRAAQNQSRKNVWWRLVSLPNSYQCVVLYRSLDRAFCVGA